MTITIQVGIKKVTVPTMDDLIPPVTIPEISYSEEMMVHFFCGQESHCVHESVSVRSIDACRASLSHILQEKTPSCRHNPLLARFLSELDVFLERIQKSSDDIQLHFLGSKPKALLAIPKTKAGDLFIEANDTVSHIDRVRRFKFFCLSSAGITAACALLIGCLAAINSSFLTQSLAGSMGVSIVLAIGIACAVAGAVLWKRSIDKYQLFTGVGAGTSVKSIHPEGARAR